MKGILKIYHPDETLKYNIDHTYCKAVYLNQKHFLEVEISTDDSLDHVEDDSLQNNFPQLSMQVSDFPIDSGEIDDKTFNISDSDDDSYTDVNLFDDEDAFLYNSELCFEKNENGELQLIWKGHIDDFYTGSENPLPFRLKCELKQDEIEIDED